jgi:ATP-dependent Clp protease adaptor protein ClpS
MNPEIPQTESELYSSTAVAEEVSRNCLVVLLNDEEHTYHYVVELLTKVCKLNKQQAFRCAVEVDLSGRTPVYRGSQEACEAIKIKIETYGPDHRLPHSTGSMRAEVQS